MNKIKETLHEKRKATEDKKRKADAWVQDVILAKKGDDEAYIRMIERCKQSMYKVARSYLKNEEDIADVLQESILKCYQSLTRLQKPHFFKTWLIRIVINECNDLLRKKKRECQMEEEEMPFMGQKEQGYSNVEFEDLMQCIPEKYRTILVLYYAEGYNSREIAMMLGMRSATVRTRLVRGRTLLKIYLGDK